jgi:hypothetical protein
VSLFLTNSVNSLPPPAGIVNTPLDRESKAMFAIKTKDFQEIQIDKKTIHQIGYLNDIMEKYSKLNAPKKLKVDVHLKDFQLVTFYI